MLLNNSILQIILLVIFVAGIIIKGLSMAKTSKIEMLFMNEEKKMIAHLMNFILLSILIFFSIFLIRLMILGNEGFEEGNEFADINVYFFISTYIASVIVIAFISMIDSYISRKHTFYINDTLSGGVPEKLYLIKTTKDRLVLLSNNSKINLKAPAVNSDKDFSILIPIDKFANKKIYIHTEDSDFQKNKEFLLNKLNFLIRNKSLPK